MFPRTSAVILLTLVALSSAEIRIRHRRSLEKEDNDVVVITSTRPGPSVPSYSHDAFDFKFNEDTGAFNLGGQLPTFCCNHGVHQMPSIAELFEQMQRRMEEMTRQFASTMGHGNFSTSTDYPNGYNKTDTEIVEIDGKKFLKKTTVIKKGGDVSAIFIKSTSYEPLDETNVIEGEGSSETPALPDESKPAVPSELPTPGEAISPSSSDASGSTVLPDTGLEREELSTPSATN